MHAFTKHFIRILQQSSKFDVIKREDQINCFDFILECIKSENLRKFALFALETATIESTIFTLVQMDIEKLRALLFNILQTCFDSKKPTIDWMLALNILLDLRVLDTITTPLSMSKLIQFFKKSPPIFSAIVLSKLKLPAEQHVFADIILDLIKLPSLLVEMKESCMARALNFIFFESHHSVCLYFSKSISKLEYNGDLLPSLVNYSKLALQEAIESDVYTKSTRFLFKCTDFLFSILPKKVQPVGLLLELFHVCTLIHPDMFSRLCRHAEVVPNFIPVSFVRKLHLEGKYSSIPLACQLCGESVNDIVKLIVAEIKLNELDARNVAIYNTPETECYESPISTSTISNKKGEDWELNIKRKLTNAELALIKSRLSEEAQIRNEVQIIKKKNEKNLNLLHELILKAQAFPIEFTPLAQSSGIIVDSLLSVLEYEKKSNFVLLTPRVITILETAGKWTMEDDFDDIVLFAIYQSKNYTVPSFKKHANGKKLQYY